jgi:hypothetical protein
LVQFTGGFTLKKIFVILLVVLCAAVAVAQDAPKAEIFGGYQWTNFDTKDTTLGRQNMSGWDADAAFNLNKHFGIVGDISGAYKTETINDSTLGNITGKLRVYNYLFGPRFSYRTDKVTAFGEALFGGGHLSLGAEQSGVNGSVSSNGFAMAIGGGFDINAGKHIAIRPAKFDYVLNHISADQGLISGASTNLNNFRYAGGIVFKF